MGAYAAIDKCGCVTAIANSALGAKHLGPILTGMSRWAKDVRLVTSTQAVGALCTAQHNPRLKEGCPHPDTCPDLTKLTQEG